MIQELLDLFGNTVELADAVTNIPALKAVSGVKDVVDNLGAAHGLAEAGVEMRETVKSRPSRFWSALFCNTLKLAEAVVDIPALDVAPEIAERLADGREAMEDALADEERKAGAKAALYVIPTPDSDRVDYSDLDIAGLEGKALYLAGAEHYLGVKGQARDFKLAAKYFQASADREYPDGQYCLGLMYLYGEAVPADWRTALNRFRSAAINLYEPAYSKLADLLMEKWSELALDESETVAWLELAAYFGHAPAQEHLSAQYLTHARMRDLEKAAYWTLALAKGGRQEAQAAVDTLTRQGVSADPAALAEAYAKGINGKNQDRARAVYWLEAAAFDGDAEAAYQLGLKCENDDRDYINYIFDPEIWYAQAAEKGHAEAARRLRLLETPPAAASEAPVAAVENDEAPEADEENDDLAQADAYYDDGEYAKALPLYQHAAEAGDGYAMYSLGFMSEKGEGVKRDAKKAAEWYQKSAEAGYRGGQFSLGLCYEEGVGVRKNAAKALHWYELAAGQDHPDALYNLGNVYLQGELAQEDDGKSAAFFRRAAELGHEGAMFALGRFYEAGVGVEEDRQKAAEWIEKAAALGHEEAQAWLDGGADEAGEEDEGNADSDLADGYHDAGAYKKAFSLYLKAAEAGYGHAQYMLAGMYEAGEGVKPDAKKAVEWYKKAAGSGVVDAWHDLGRAYRDGEGIKKNLEKAIYWFEKAMERDDPYAIRDMGGLYLEGRGVEQDEDKAVEYFRRAAALDCADAMYRLGLCYEEGLGVDQDMEEARRWMKKAAELEDEDAREWLEENA